MSAAAIVERSHVRRAYRRLFELGRGGMARVYLAESLASGVRKLVVLKALNPNLSADPEMREAFRREAELSAQMNHPNVVQVMEVVEHAQTPIIVMEYLDGVTLSSLLKRARKDLPLALHLNILSQVLAGLHHFHELRDLEGAPLEAVHRDVSPQNIMVLHEGGVKVLDFGIAKVSAPSDHATRTGIIKGKIQYMPPEQLLGRTKLDRRADVFAVGVMLWEAAAGRRLWKGSTEIELVRNLASGAVPSLREHAPHVPDPIVQVAERAMEIDCARRFATAKDMQAALDRALTDLGWFVRPRELADFMARHFGASRAEQEQKIKQALLQASESPPPADGLEAASLPALEIEPSAFGTVAPLGSPEARVESAPPTQGALDASATHLRRRNVRRSVATAALIACFALALLGLTRNRPSAAPVVSTRSATTTVSLQVDALPHGAQIYLDGALLGSDHFAGSQPVRDHKAVLEVSAPGHLSERKEISLRKDIDLQIVLRPDPAANSETVKPDSTMPAPDGSSASPRTRTRNGGRPSSKSSGNGSAKCTPPYTLGPDGIKTYKPECF
ncbi:MAG TPA: serine/threonine-protein kinase [Polyangiaceae bacterium]|nr:serine/threonine-protein kinase [Polyangiaceae bacterium]